MKFVAATMALVLSATAAYAQGLLVPTEPFWTHNPRLANDTELYRVPVACICLRDNRGDLDLAIMSDNELADPSVGTAVPFLAEVRGNYDCEAICDVRVAGYRCLSGVALVDSYSTSFATSLRYSGLLFVSAIVRQVSSRRC